MVGLAMVGVQKGIILLYYIPFANIWVFPKIGVPPNHPFLIGFSILNHPFLGTPIFGNTHMYMYLEPVCPVFWGFKLPKQTKHQAKQLGHLGSRYTFKYG